MLRINSTLVWALNPDMDLRFEKDPEKENQRMFCLKELVGLAPQKEELGKNEYTVVNILHTRVLVNLSGDGGLSG